MSSSVTVLTMSIASLLLGVAEIQIERYVVSCDYVDMIGSDVSVCLVSSAEDSES